MGSELTNNLQAWLSREKHSRFIVSCPLINVATIASCVLVTWSSTSKHVVNLLTVIVSTEKQKMNDTINSLTKIGWLCFHLVSLCVQVCRHDNVWYWGKLLPQSAWLVIHAALSQVFYVYLQDAVTERYRCWVQLKIEGRYWDVMQFHAENWPKALVIYDLGSGLRQLQSLLEESLYSSFLSNLKTLGKPQHDLAMGKYLWCNGTHNLRVKHVNCTMYYL